jgi:hypothetical protein
MTALAFFLTSKSGNKFSNTNSEKVEGPSKLSEGS